MSEEISKLVTSALDNETKATLTRYLNELNIAHVKPSFIAPTGMMQVHDLERFMPFPQRTRKLVGFIEAESFLTYFEAFKAGYQPRLFVKNQDDGMKIACVFDYDEPNSLPRWNDHIATLELAYHPDYKALRDYNSKWFAQADFSLFVEENLHLFVAPDSATMLELAQHLKGSKNASWQSGKRLTTGATALEFIETIEGKGVRDGVEIPEYLLLKTPMYEGGSDQEIKAAFSWKIDNEGKVFFLYRLLTKVAERKAQEEMKSYIAQKTGLPVLAVSGVGIPGSPKTLL